MSFCSVAGLEEIIDKIVLSRTTSFYPEYVVQESGCSYEKVYNYLLNLVTLEKLTLKWDVLCTTPGCCYTIGRYDDYRPLIKREICCRMCGECVLVTDENIFPVFEFNPVYKKERQITLRGFKKKQLNRICLAIR